MQPAELPVLEPVRDFMLNMCRISEGRGWATLSEIAEMTGVHETYVSVNLRHLRKTRYGSYIVDKRHRENIGTYEYRVRERARLSPSPVSRSRGSRGHGSASSVVRFQEHVAIRGAISAIQSAYVDL